MSNKLKVFISIAVLFGIAIWADVHLLELQEDAGHSFNFNASVQFFNFGRFLTIAFFLCVFFISNLMKNEGNKPAWLIILFGSLFMGIDHFRPGRDFQFIRDFYHQIVRIETSRLSLTYTFCSILIAMGIYHLVRNKFSKKLP